MKWLIASDLHGSSFYTKQLLAAYENEQADRMLLLGDLLYHGPRNDLPEGYAPKEVAALLNAYASDICCVRGNCDAEVDQMMLDFPIMAEYALIQEGPLRIYATHGHVFNRDHLPKLHEGDILLYGHTHVPLCEEVKLPGGGYITCMNPGSVSIPKEGSGHGYLILEDAHLTRKSLDRQRSESEEDQ